MKRTTPDCVRATEPGVRNMGSQFSLQTIKSGAALPVARTDS